MRMRYPSTMKAPGARTKTKAPYCSGKIVTLNIFPVPKNSRTAPKRVSAPVNPKPIPTPSRCVLPQMIQRDLIRCSLLQLEE